MTTKSNEYWPFSVSDEDRSWPEMLEKISFLEGLHLAGFRAFRSGINDYGAESENRDGIIIERGRNMWEVRLSKDGDRCFSAFVSKFATAGEALGSWLKGASEHGVFSSIKDDLVVPPGCSTSYTMSKKAEAFSSKR
jgi:hypothetical protein